MRPPLRLPFSGGPSDWVRDRCPRLPRRLGRCGGLPGSAQPRGSGGGAERPAHRYGRLAYRSAGEGGEQGGGGGRTGSPQHSLPAHRCALPRPPPVQGFVPFGPTVGTAYLPSHPLDAFQAREGRASLSPHVPPPTLASSPAAAAVLLLQAGNVADVPIIMGTVRRNGWGGTGTVQPFLTPLVSPAIVRRATRRSSSSGRPSPAPSARRCEPGGRDTHRRRRMRCSLSACLPACPRSYAFILAGLLGGPAHAAKIASL